MSQLKRSKEGVLSKRTDGMRKEWKQFNFKHSQAYFQYFKGNETSKAEGQLLTSQITKVESTISKYIGEYPFEVHFNARGSPWTLCAASEEERIAWMEVIRPGSAAHLRPAPQPQQPLTMSLPPGFGGFPTKREAQLPYVLHPGQQQPLKSQQSLPPPQPQPAVAESPQRQSSQHSLRLTNSLTRCAESPEPYMEPDPSTTGVPPAAVSPPQTPPIPPSRTLSGRLQHAHTFPEADTDDAGYIMIQQTPVASAMPPKRPSLLLSAKEDSVPSCQEPATPVTAVVDLMKNMSPEQVETLMQMLSKLTTETETDKKASVQPPQLLKMISESPNVGDALLVTEDDENYEPRPEWVKADARSTDDDLGQASDLQKEALFISSSSISDHVPIGKGQFGEVFKAILHKGTPGEVVVAVKTTKKNPTNKERADFMKEMTTMSTLLHPNIVRLYGLVNENQESSSIVLEYLPYGDLKSFLTKNPRPIKQLVKYMIDVAMGMHYISERGLVHRDLAARNVLVGENEICKVADFGLLRELPEDNSIYQSKGSVPLPVRWMAPESIQRKKFSVASDVWSYGILMWEMFNPDKVPYPTMNNMECIAKVSEGFRLPAPRGSPPIIVRLMRACWHKQPEKRPSFLIISTLLTTKAFAEIEMSNSKS